MSDDQAISYTVNTGDWWWLAGYIHMYAEAAANQRQLAGFPPIRWDETPVAGGIRIEGWLEDRSVLFLQITATKRQTFISASERFPFERFWTPIINGCLNLERNARDYQRVAIGRRFEELLNDYYHRRAMGQSPNLRAMSEEYGVNYGSLRQYKIKYDRERRRLLANEENI
jgi:hypothetical protein